MKIAAVLLVFVITVTCPRADAAGTDGTLPAGAPSWFPLGGEVYHEQNRIDAQNEILSFKAEPRWFLSNPKMVSQPEYESYLAGQHNRIVASGGRYSYSYQHSMTGKYPIPGPDRYPAKVADLPLVDRGASLTLAAEAGDAAAPLLLVLTLRAQDRPLSREVEHRWTNTLPLLFAFWVDGTAVTKRLSSFGKEGGVNQQVSLVEKRGSLTWKIKADRKSIDAILATSSAKSLQIVAAFCERQHEGYFGKVGSARAAFISEWSLSSEFPGPPILIRSNVLRLKRVKNSWQPTAAK